MNYEEQLEHFTKQYEELIETSNIAELQRMAEGLKEAISRQMSKFTDLYYDVVNVSDDIPYFENRELYMKFDALSDKIRSARDDSGCGIYVYSRAADGIIPWSESYC